ncbi:MAG: hypothetical protein Q8R83_07560 [Legionellaceae bacterium]|nr:hypothetical protein [Legionellaceae bacterium]
MLISTKIFTEKNGSTTLDIDLTEYLRLVKTINTSDISLYSTKYKRYLRLYNELSEITNPVGMLQDKMTDGVLTKFTEEEQQIIFASPGYNLLHDSFFEILKNAIDAVIEYHLKDHRNDNTHVYLNFNIEISNNEIIMTFLDAGPGFPPDFLLTVENERQQLNYLINNHWGNSDKKKRKLKGLLGGAGQGVHHLIFQILTGREFNSRIAPVRSPDFSSAIKFSNNGASGFPGAKIEITTQKSPFLINEVNGSDDTLSEDLHTVILRSFSDDSLTRSRSTSGTTTIESSSSSIPKKSDASSSEDSPNCPGNNGFFYNPLPSPNPLEGMSDTENEDDLQHSIKK